MHSLTHILIPLAFVTLTLRHSLSILDHDFLIVKKTWIKTFGVFIVKNDHAVNYISNRILRKKNADALK